MVNISSEVVYFIAEKIFLLLFCTVYNYVTLTDSKRFTTLVKLPGFRSVSRITFISLLFYAKNSVMCDNSNDCLLLL